MNISLEYTYFFFKFYQKNKFNTCTCIIERNCIYLQTKKEIITILKKDLILA